MAELPTTPTPSAGDGGARATEARARALLEVGRAGSAKELLLAAGAPDAGPPELAFLLAQAHLALHWPSTAIKAAEAGLRREPTAEWGLRLRALGLLRIGATDQGVATAEELVRQHPHTASAHWCLGHAYLFDHLPDHALAPALEAIRLDPQDPDHHVLAGRVELALGHARAARQHFETALEVDPENAAARNDLGRVELRRGRIRHARQHFRGAARLDPTGVGPDNIRVADHAASVRRLAHAGILALLAILVFEPGMVLVALFGLSACARASVHHRPRRPPKSALGTLVRLLLSLVATLGLIVAVALVLAAAPATTGAELRYIALLWAAYGSYLLAFAAIDRVAG